MDSAANDEPPEEWEEVLSLLRQLQSDSRPIFAHLRSHGRQGSSSTSEIGDIEIRVDVAADTWLREWICAHFESGIVQSEERKQSGALQFGIPGHGFHFVVDPIDGLDNFNRGLPPSAYSLAILPRLGALSIKQVEYAFLGDTSGSAAFVAARGRGAFVDRTRIETSNVTRARDAIISREFTRAVENPKLAKLHRTCAGVRSFGCSSRAISLVALGALDAHVDASDLLTPEGLLAASLIVTEAGGHLCTLTGQSIGSFRSLQDRTTLIAAANQELAEDIVRLLSK